MLPLKDNVPQIYLVLQPSLRLHLYLRLTSVRTEQEKRNRSGHDFAFSPLRGLALYLYRHRFEHRWIEMMTLQQLIELGAVAFGQTRRLGHIAVGNLQ